MANGKFPPDEIVPDEIVTFQDGKIVKESELQPDGGAIWEEEPPLDDFMYGHLNGTSHNLAPPGPPAAVTGNASWAYFERASNSHMYQLHADDGVPTREHGTGQSFGLDVCYDSGSSAMAIPLGDLMPYMTFNRPDNLRQISTDTPAGRTTTYSVNLNVRVLCRKGEQELISWRVVRCNVYRESRHCIFRGNLEKDLFICNYPGLQHLYAARTKAQLVLKMAK